MKQQIKLLLAVLTLNIQMVNAQIVTRDNAVAVAKHYLSCYKDTIYEVESVRGSYSSDSPLLYHVNFQNGTWCMVPGDMRFEPVLAFGFSRWDEEDIPEALVMLIESYKSQIDSIVSNESRDSVTTHPLWEQYLQPNRSYPHYQLEDCLLDKDRPDTMRLAWNQSFNNSDENNCTPSYNQDCPESNNSECSCGHKPTGCAPVAMGEVMWYWQWPRESSYRKYHWEHMPPFMDNDTDPWEASNISRLLRDLGRATWTIYTCDGSGTWYSFVEDALRNDFGYTTAKQMIAWNWRYGTAWNDLIKSEIDNNRPVIFYGDNGTIFKGHYFVLDGYKDEDGLLRYHVNWGHGGDYQDFFMLDNMWEDMGGTIHYYNRGNLAYVGVSPTYTDEYLDSLTYSWVPSYRNRKEYAYHQIAVPKAGNELIVEANAHLEFEAGEEVILQPGFYARFGSEVDIHVNPDWQDGMTIHLISYPTNIAIGEDCKITTKKADSWEFQVERRTSEDTTIIYQSAGSIRSDITNIWSVSNQVSPGVYYCSLALKNSYGRRTESQFQINVIPYRESEQGDDDVLNAVFVTHEDTNGVIPVDFHPNPTSGEVIVTMEDEVQGIILYNTQGQPVGGWKILSLAGNRATLDVSALPAGPYLVRIATPAGSVIRKLLVQRR